MKKILLALLIAAITGVFGIAARVNASDSDNKIINGAISKYKQKNYIGCISDLKEYTKKDKTSAVAWYYLGSSYMKIAMTDEANEAFEKTIELNTVPILTSYAIQAQMCMENNEKCKYKDFTYDEIKKLKADPAAFMVEYNQKKEEAPKKETDVEIDKLIKGAYSNNIHPSARDFIMQERAKMKQNEINSSNKV